MYLLLFCLLPAFLIAQTNFGVAEITRMQARANRTEIIRDTWGVPHVYAPTDADAVFGMLYVQCEDDFKRVERNYIDALGRMAQAYGEDYIYHDLRARLFMDSTEAIAYYDSSPAWLQELCDAFADGINYYLHTHPEVQPDLLTRFEPWFPFTFSEGSIGGDITRVSLRGLQAFYGENSSGYTEPQWQPEEEMTKSNGFSVAPERTAHGNALLLINPHTSFYFRSELQVNSDEGLQAYGAVTWGQFFIYQGFNAHCGWMHTSTRADAIDRYRETIIREDDRYYYKYGDTQRKVEERSVRIPYRDGSTMRSRQFTTYHTHHGPVIGRSGEEWITFRMMERPIDALQQSFLRTKAQSYNGFRKTMEIRTNSSNNTVFAAQGGHIAYWHGNFMPRRNPAYDYNGYIDGSDPEKDWRGLHPIDDLIEVHNPSTGWIQNCNATPFTVSGTASPLPQNYPTYMAPDSENYRGLNAARILAKADAYTLDKLIAAANDPTLLAFKALIPALLNAYANAGDKSDPQLAQSIAMLRNWDYSYGEASIPTAVAIYWGERMLQVIRGRITAADRRADLLLADYILRHATQQEMVEQLQASLIALEEDFGDWRTPWGAINRFQRLTGDIQEQYDDDLPSIPVGFTSARWGALAAFYTESPGAGTKRRYGRSGNSFVAVVEFGPRLRAKAILSGGQSGDPESSHFTDQAQLFSKGQLRDVFFYRQDVETNAERSYRPGE